MVLWCHFTSILKASSFENDAKKTTKAIKSKISMRSSCVKVMNACCKRKRAYTSSLECMTNITEQGNMCRTDTDVRLPKMLLKNGYGRFCTEASFYKEYQASAECFATNTPVTSCYNTYLTQAREQAKTVNQDPENFNYDELCKPITTLIHCANTAIGGTCGKDALLLAKLLYPGAMLVEIYDCMSDIRDKTGDDLYTKMTDPQDHGSYLPWTSGAAYLSPLKPITTLVSVVVVLISFLQRE